MAGEKGGERQDEGFYPLNCGQRSGVWRAVRSARAALVIWGGAPSEVGKTLMSATKLPSAACSSPRGLRWSARGLHPAGTYSAGGWRRDRCCPRAHLDARSRRSPPGVGAAGDPACGARSLARPGGGGPEHLDHVHQAPRQLPVIPLCEVVLDARPARRSARHRARGRVVQ